jgi:hypothetical protein
MTLSKPRPAFQVIPDPQEVQRLLAQAAHEASLLRSLLRLAKRKQRAMEREQLQQQEHNDHVG